MKTDKLLGVAAAVSVIVLSLVAAENFRALPLATRVHAAEVQKPNETQPQKRPPVGTKAASGNSQEMVNMRTVDGGILKSHGHVCKNFRLYWPTAQLCFDKNLGREILIVFDDAGTGGRLLVIDFETGTTTGYPFPDGGAAWHAKRVRDGTLWIGLNRIGQLAHFDPTARKYLPVARNPLGGQRLIKVCDLTEGEDGRIYYGTYGKSEKGQLWRYDPKTATHELLIERIDPSNNFPYCMTTGFGGRIFVAMACNAHRLWCYDPHDGSLKNMTPKQYQRPGLWNLPVAYGKWVLIEWYDRDTYEMEVHLYDGETLEFVKALRMPGDTRSTGDITAIMLTADNRLMVKAGRGDYRYLEVPSMKLSPGYKFENAHGHMQVEPTMDGQRLITGWGQEYGMAPMTGGRIEWRLPDIEPTKCSIFALSGHEDGRVYGTASLGNTMFWFDPKTGRATNTGQIADTGGEAYGICSYDAKLYTASYTWAVITVYDPNKPWNQGETADSNPRTIGRIGHDQYRPVGGIHVGPRGLLVVGTAPNYGMSGGAFSVINPKTDEIEVYRNYVPGGTVKEFASDGKVLFGYGGGEFFVWDPDTKEITFRNTMPGGPMAFSRSKLYMVSGGELVGFDLSTRSFAAVPNVTLAHVPRQSLKVGRDGRLYAISNGTLVEIDPEKGEMTAFAATRGQAGSCLTATPDAAWWFASRSGLYSFVIPTE